MHGPVDVLPFMPSHLEFEAINGDRGRKDDQTEMRMRSDALPREHCHHIGRR